MAGSTRASVAADLLALGAVAALLAAVQFVLLPGTQARLAFRNDLADPLGALTAAYVHLDRPHLLGNLLGYALAAGATYGLCLRLGERRWFRLSTVTLLVAAPVLVNLTSAAVLGVVLGGRFVPTNRGFSGVVAGFGGFLFVALFVTLRRAWGRLPALYLSLLVVLGLVGELLLIYAPWPPLLGGGLVLLGVALGLAGLARESHRRGLPGEGYGPRRAFAASLPPVLAVVVLAVLVYGLFPERLVAGGRFVNVVAHGAGLLYGAALSGWGYRYWAGSTDSTRISG